MQSFFVFFFTINIFCDKIKMPNKFNNEKTSIVPRGIYTLLTFRFTFSNLVKMQVPSR